jgi:hypothetical protein
MKIIFNLLILLGVLIGASEAEIARDQGLSLHMLPKEVAEISGDKWGFTVALPGGQDTGKTIQSADELKEYFLSLPKPIQDNGIWVVFTYPGSYSDMEKEILQSVKKMCLDNRIPLFICRASNLPDGWKRVEEKDEIFGLGE